MAASSSKSSGAVAAEMMKVIADPRDFSRHTEAVVSVIESLGMKIHVKSFLALFQSEYVNQTLMMLLTLLTQILMRYSQVQRGTSPVNEKKKCHRS